jgi:hypothetical protein
MNLVHIVDNLNDKQYIYSNGLDISLEEAAKSLVEELKNTNWSLLQNVEYNILDNTCEIFVNEQIIERGWVWNSKNTTRKLLYKLSYIPLFFVEQKPKQIEQSTQTDQTVLKQTCVQTSVQTSVQASVQTTDVTSSTSKLYKENSDINFGNFCDFDDYKIDLSLDNFKNTFTGYSNNPFDPLNNNPIGNSSRNYNPFVSNPFQQQQSQTNIWSAPEHKYAIQYTAPLDVEHDIGTVSYSEKYVNPYAYPNNDLNIEIKRRLALPKFGLRSFKQD